MSIIEFVDLKNMEQSSDSNTNENEETDND